jgi:hypothetical protein
LLPYSFFFFFVMQIWGTLYPQPCLQRFQEGVQAPHFSCVQPHLPYRNREYVNLHHTDTLAQQMRSAIDNVSFS